jgi:hypothetical protein
MPTAAWEALPEQIEVPVFAGYVFDRPSPAELNATMDDYEARAGFRLPATYREFLHQFGPGELAGYFRISGPIPPRLKGQVSEAFDIDAQKAMLDDPEGYWAEWVAPTLTRRLVLFVETIGGDWLFWNVDEVLDPSRTEYGVYGFARGDRHGGQLVARSFAEFITAVCLDRGFPVTNYPWEPRWEFGPAWPLRPQEAEPTAAADRGGMS